MDSPADGERFLSEVLSKLSQSIAEGARWKQEIAALRRERDEHEAQARVFVEHAATLMGTRPAEEKTPKSPCILVNKLLSDELGVVKTDVKTLQDQSDLLRLEIDAVRKENVERTAEIKSRDNSIQSLRRQLDEAQRLLRMAEISNEMLGKASDDMVGSIKKLEEEKAALQEENQKLKEDSRLLRTKEEKRALFQSTLENLQTSVRKLPQTHFGSTLAGSAENADRKLSPRRSAPVISKEPSEDPVSFADLGETYNQPVYVPSIPKTRRAKFDSFPSVVIDDDCNNSAMFSRKFLAEHIGGSCQPLVVRITNSHKEIARRLNINSFLCPNLDLNPWCPIIPGDHGYMFVGLGTEKNIFEIPETHQLFVGLEGPKRQKLFRYMGVYKVSRSDPLPIQEWNALTNHVRILHHFCHTHIQAGTQVKDGYASLTKTRTSDSRDTEAIRADYDNGKLQVPCVLLQCIDYSDELARSLSQRVKVTKVLSPTKRPREDDEQVPSRKRRLSSNPGVING
ncbi:hypothetical protein PLEOSDRAFT_1101660 [Pleurotus ostreatus PC15]|uniref:DUF6697 domain-containing protein n=1 Tax=Pleurotus ostreatus (strain PC15) TaxID=1137138 RepID=A0A067NRU6_PLEO1|nr:hypothetical protein PLEOSDRAFT_1101660 [Pleurotus ostreatus PC15]